MRFLLLLLTFAWPAAAQNIPACTQDRVGAVACMSGKLCSCGYQRGGVMSGRPDGYTWDCGILRPACGEALGLPADSGQVPQPMPQILLPLPQMDPSTMPQRPGNRPPPNAPPPNAPPPNTPWLR